jgi:Bacterial archaeo-eukaryotic release factor family 3
MGVELNPGALSPGEWRDAAWRAMQPHFDGRLSALLAACGEARGQARGSDELQEIAAALAWARWAPFWWKPTGAWRGPSPPIRGTIRSADGAAAGGAAADPGVCDL